MRHYTKLTNASSVSSRFLSLLVLLIAGICSSSRAQDGSRTLPPGRIFGQVSDQAGRPIQSATISLLQITDSVLASHLVTDKTGNFAFEKLAPGNYRILVSATGYSPYETPVVVLTLEMPVFLVKSLVLQPKSTELAQVSVIGKKSYFEQKADRMVINVDASPSNTGASALDLLEKSPGITIDKDGNISLKGRQGVTVMIDNRPTYMTGTQLTNYLRSLPATAIDQLEIMTNPSSKYDAAGNSGIINLKTRKNRAGGFNGSITLTHTQSVYGKPGGSLNLNEKTGRFNLFFNGGFQRWQGYRELNLTRKYLDPETREVNSVFTQLTHGKYNNPSFNAKLGADYYFDKNTTFGIVLSGFQNRNNMVNTSDILLKNAQNQVDSIVFSTASNKNRWKNGSVNLNFRRQFDSAGKELTADLDYARYIAGGDQYIDNSNYTPDMVKKSGFILTGNLPSDIDIYSFKTDYTHPLGKDFKLEAGIKTSYVKTDNTAAYFNLVEGVQEPDTTKTNRFLYTENINAAYLNLNRQYKKWGIQAGFRLENTHYSGHQLGNPYSLVNHDSSFSRTYTNLFPTIYLSYRANTKNQLALNFGRRIDRPAYENLNPFLFFLDQYTYQAGNPWLQPQYTNNIELSHTYNNFLTTTLNYGYTSNFFAQTYQQQDHSTIIRNGNLGSRQNAGIAVSANLPVFKWWTAILYTNLNYSHFDGMVAGEPVKVDAANLSMNLNNQLKFIHGWGAELSGFYRGKGVEGQEHLNQMGQVSIAVTKQIWKEQGSLKLGIRDLFYTGAVSGQINFQETEASFHNKRDSRECSLSLTWRFGKPVKNVRPGRDHGAGEEQNRVKSGG